MSRVSPWGRVAVLAITTSLIAAACSDDDDSADSTKGDASSNSSSSASAGKTGGGPSLKGVCPDPLVVQTDWFPEPEHGGLYELIGTDGKADAGKGTYTGELANTGINLEIRAGGPFLGGSSTSAQMYADQDIFMGYVATDELIKDSAKTPLVSVVSPLEKSPQILMWDPKAFPDIKTFEDIGKTGAPVLYFEGSAYMDFLVGKGLIKKKQIDASYDGAPSRFVTEHVFQQGFASNEPYKYENDIKEWKKPVKYLLIDDAGYRIYPSSLAVRPERTTKDAKCLKAVVPLMQQAQVDYMADPKPINDFFLGYVQDMASFWTLSAAGNADAVKVLTSEGLVSNGPDKTIGNFDTARVQKLIDDSTPIFKAAGVDTMKAGLKADDIVSNEFIDTSIGLP